MRRLLIAAVLFIASCATTLPSGTVREHWLPADPQAWEKVQNTGVRLTRKDKSTVFIPAAVVRNMVDAKRKIEAASGVYARIAVVDMDGPNAFTAEKDGTNVVALSVPWLNALGTDRDAVATTLGHEYAHLKLHPLRGAAFVARGFTSGQEREADELGMRWAVESGFSACGRIRTLMVYQQANPGAAAGSFLASHPGTTERVAHARAIAQQRGETCPAT